jgi:hypothetical protein
MNDNVKLVGKVVATQVANQAISWVAAYVVAEATRQIFKRQYDIKRIVRLRKPVKFGFSK